MYDAENWPDLSGSARSAAFQAPFAPFALDAFAYPPPFLLLPRALLPLGDFRSQRAAWFGLNGLLLAVGLWTVAAFVGGRGQVRALLLAPVLWCSLPALVTLQIGNAHAAVLVLAMLGMVAFESERPALGGALLAFSILAKISPGLLVVMLLVRRRFREVLWTAAFGLGFALLALAVFGSEPFEAFIRYQMPRLSSGEALSFLAREDSVSINLAPFGIPFKLAALGAHVADVWKTAKVVNLAFTAAVVVVTVVAARRDTEPGERAMLWLAVLTFGTLRSPFAPPYVVVPALWLISLWAAEIRGRVGAIGLMALWIATSVTPPLPLRPLAALTIVQQMVLIGMVGYLALRAGSARPRRPGV